MAIKPFPSLPPRSQAVLQAALRGAMLLKEAEAQSWQFKLKGHHEVTAFPFSCAEKINVEMGYTIADT